MKAYIGKSMKIAPGFERRVRFEHDAGFIRIREGYERAYFWMSIFPEKVVHVHVGLREAMFLASFANHAMYPSVA